MSKTPGHRPKTRTTNLSGKSKAEHKTPRQQFSRSTPGNKPPEEEKKPGRARFSRPGSDFTAEDIPAKRLWGPSALLAPVPVVLVSCGGKKDQPENLLTVAWAGTVCSTPPMVSIAVRPERFSHAIIKDTREFVINVPTQSLARATDLCGVKSGRDGDKFELAKLTRAPASKVDAPLVAECPLHLECKVRKTIPLGSHDLFLAEIVAVQVNEELLDKKGKLRLDKAELLCYAHGEYFTMGKKIGFFGYSVKKAATKRR